MVALSKKINFKENDNEVTELFDENDFILKENRLQFESRLKEKADEKRATPLPGNETVPVTNIVNLRAGLKTNQVREADFS